MMENKKSLFSGFPQVFNFTLKQITRGRGFKIATFGFAILFFIVCFGINVGIAMFSQNKEEISPIEKVYVYVPDGFENTSIDTNSILAGTEFKSVNIEGVKAAPESLKDKEAFLNITKSGDEYKLELTINNSGKISEKEGYKFLGYVEDYLKQYLYLSSGIDGNQLTVILSPVNSAVTEVSEDGQSIGEMLIKIFVPMLLSFILYFLLIYHGQSIGKSLISEKASKLMELLLISVEPYAIVAGKILATAIIAIVQMFSWIVGAILGFAIGNKVAELINPSYNNVVVNVIKMIKDNTASDAFSIGVIIIAVIAVCLGFLFFSVLAGLIYSNINKPEELSSGTSIFNIFAVVGFFSSYFLTAFGSGSEMATLILHVLRYVPVVSPFILPADILVGNISIAGGVISLLITVMCTFVLVMLTGRVYKKKMFG